MSAFTSRDVFDGESMLQERSKTKDKAQDGTPDSSVGSQTKEVELLDGPKKPDWSDKNS